MREREREGEGEGERERESERERDGVTLRGGVRWVALSTLFETAPSVMMLTPPPNPGTLQASSEASTGAPPPRTSSNHAFSRRSLKAWFGPSPASPPEPTRVCLLASNDTAGYKAVS